MPPRIVALSIARSVASTHARTVSTTVAPTVTPTFAPTQTPTLAPTLTPTLAATRPNPHPDLKPGRPLTPPRCRATALVPHCLTVPPRATPPFHRPQRHHSTARHAPIPLLAAPSQVVGQGEEAASRQRLDRRHVAGAEDAQHAVGVPRRQLLRRRAVARTAHGIPELGQRACTASVHSGRGMQQPLLAFATRERTRTSKRRRGARVKRRVAMTALASHNRSATETAHPFIRTNRPVK